MLPQADGGGEALACSRSSSEANGQEGEGSCCSLRVQQ
jgi:hypothetical protein